MISFIYWFPGRGKFAIKSSQCGYSGASPHCHPQPDNFYFPFEKQGSHQKLKAIPLVHLKQGSHQKLKVVPLVHLLFAKHKWWFRGALLGHSENKKKDPWIQINTPCHIADEVHNILYPLVTSGGDFIMSLEHRL